MSSLAPQRNLSTLRLYYFLLIGGGGFLFPFINLFYTQQGLSGTEIGLLSTFASLAALIAAPWWGRRGDSTQRSNVEVQNLGGPNLVLADDFRKDFNQAAHFSGDLVIPDIHLGPRIQVIQLFHLRRGDAEL